MIKPYIQGLNRMSRIAKKRIEPINGNMDPVPANVFSSQRRIVSPEIALPEGLAFNKRIKMDGIEFLDKIPEDSVPVAFFDPQYRGVLDKLSYGNEGEKRGQRRCSLPQMDETIIKDFIRGIAAALIPSGHLFLWLDKYHLCTGIQKWINGSKLEIVDLLTWNKKRMGMGYRSRKISEYLIVLQKPPCRAKGVWQSHDIPDSWIEKVERKDHPHRKPVDLQGELLSAVSNEGDVVIDPAAGSFSVMEACFVCNRTFLGCDING